MCIIDTPDVPDVKAPQRYAKQKQPNRSDTTGAADRAAEKRKRGTNTILTQDAAATGNKKTLLGS